MHVFYLFVSLLLCHALPMFAEIEEAPPPPEQSIWQMVSMIVIAIAFFYFLLYRPEQKRRKALEEQRNSMQQGDRVVAMGIIGTVLRVQEETVILKMFDGGKIEVLKGAITDVSSEPETTPKGES